MSETVTEMIERLGLEGLARRDPARPVWRLRRGSAEISVVGGAELVVCTARVLERARPDDAGLLRRLLRANQLMKGAVFSVEPDGSVRINQVVPVDGLDDEVLAWTIGNLAEQADRFDDVIRERAWERAP
jgi:hypothetical protein